MSKSRRPVAPPCDPCAPALPVRWDVLGWTGEVQLFLLAEDGAPLLLETGAEILLES